MASGNEMEGLVIPVVAQAEEGSGANAVHKLTQEFLRVLKNGYIEVPTKLDFGKNASKELNAAQKDLVKKWNTVAKEGFFADATILEDKDKKQLDEFITSFKKVEQLVKSERKYNTQTWKQNKEGQVGGMGSFKALSTTLHDYENSVRDFNKQIEKSRAVIDKRSVTAKTENKSRKTTSEETHRPRITSKRDKLISQYYKDDGGKLDQIVKDSFNGVTAVLNSTKATVSANLTPITNATTNSARTISQQFAQDRVADTMAHADNTQQLQVEKEHKEISDADRNSGVNTDKKSDELIDAVKQGNSIKQSNTVKVEQSVDENKDNKTFNANTAEGLKQLLSNTTIGAMSGKCPCETILNAILKQLKDMQEYLKAVIVYLYTEPISEQQKKRQTKQQLEEKIAEQSDTRKKMFKVQRAIPMPSDWGKGLTTTPNKSNNNPRNLPIPAQYIENGKIRNSKVIDRSYSDNLPQLNTPNLQKQKAFADSIKATTSEKYYRKQVEDLFKQKRKEAKSTYQAELNSIEIDRQIRRRNSLQRNIEKRRPELNTRLRENRLRYEQRPDEATRRKQLRDEFRASQRQAAQEEQQRRKAQLQQRMTRRRPLLEQKLRENRERYEERQRLERTVLLNQIGAVDPSRLKTQAPTANLAFFGKLQSILDRTFNRIFPQGETEVDRLLAMNREERAKETADRLTKFGETKRPDDLSATGSIASIAYLKRFWRGTTIGPDSPLFQDTKLTSGVGDINIDDLMSNFREAIEKNMFKAQTGGGIFKNLFGAITLYAGQPSIEKSRAQIEGLNQVFANIRNKFERLANSLLTKEATLQEMERRGDIRIGSDGRRVFATQAAEKTFIDYENQKQTMRSAVADITTMNDVVGQYRNNVDQILKHIGFTIPEFQEENVIIQNINSGLDKGGKALRFQKRTQEILNYTFQRMARSVGQMYERWLKLLNPINLIKRAFRDFASYDVKWKRTMNVIKYNFRRVIRPAMEWIAQQIVNIIGLVNAVIKGIGKAFGKDLDLFDKDAANTEKMREDLEAMRNITAGFDELHDIGSNNGAENDLFGDIYTPQWDGIYNDIEGVTEKITKELTPAFETLGKIIGWCLDKWKLLVGAFLAFKLTKGLISLWRLFSRLNSLIGGISFLSLINGLLIVAGVIETIKAIWDSIDWAKHWGGMLPSERQEKGEENIKKGEIGGALLGAGIGGSIAGVPGMIIGALIGDGAGEAFIGTFNTVISAWHGDTEGTKKYAEKAGEGVGKTAGAAAGAAAGAKLGAAIGTAIAPGVGTAIGGTIGMILGGLGGWFAGSKLGKEMGKVLRRYDY